MLPIAHLRTLFTASFVALAIIACDGSSGGASTSIPLVDDPAASQPLSEEVLGPDVDADGIRDDVQMMIEADYGGDLQVMRAFKRKAITDRRAFENAHDSEALRSLAYENYNALYCFLEAFDSYPERKAALRKYRFTMRDTPERVYRGGLMDGRLNAIKNENAIPSSFECSE